MWNCCGIVQKSSMHSIGIAKGHRQDWQGIVM